ncbi:MAG: HAMP domain-containing histidine kinase [Lachnospiraceae bacterium]
MKIFVNRKIRFLFAGILWCAIAFTLISVLFAVFEVKNAVYYIIGCGLCMAAAILLLCYAYFKEQHKIMGHAIAQITEYISGDKSVTIECNDEGELYRLFHEVNSLVSILNAHIENEGKEKEFLKNIILDISHQLKTPLAALNIYNGIIQGEAESIPAIKEFADFSEQELERIETLVQNLLKISKFDAGTVVMIKALENISEMMECIKKQFSFRAGQEGKEILLEGDESIDFICDRNWLMEAVGNIVKNALDHTEKGDFVRIEWKLSASELQITVKDNGSGIHPEDLYYIFKRFYRSRYSKDTQGTGLGLPLAKSIIEAHGGSIAVDSELGDGTIFYLYLIEH